MDYAELGRSGLKVSRLALGAMTTLGQAPHFGWVGSLLFGLVAFAMPVVLANIMFDKLHNPLPAGIVTFADLARLIDRRLATSDKSLQR